MMFRRIVTLIIFALLSAASLAGCSLVATQQASPGPIVVAPVPDGWKQTDTRLGLRLGIPPGWTVRTNQFSVLAIGPKAERADDASGRYEALRVETVSHFVRQDDFNASRSVLDNAMRALKADGFSLSQSTSATVLGAPAAVVTGRRGTRTTLLLVSDNYVVHATVLTDGTSRNRATIRNVLGLLSQVGYYYDGETAASGLSSELSDIVGTLRPIRVYRHLNNLVVVQEETGAGERGKYIQLAVSSYSPHSGDEGFRFASDPVPDERFGVGALVYDYTRK